VRVRSLLFETGSRRGDLLTSPTWAGQPSFTLRLQATALLDMATKANPGTPSKCAIDAKQSPTTAQTPGRKRRRRGTDPQPGSLFDTLRRRSGESLYVLPLCWTDQHTQLLDVHYALHEPITTPVPGPVHDPDRVPSVAATALCAELNMLVDRTCNKRSLKTRAIKDVFSLFFPETLMRSRTSAELTLYFGGRAYPKAVRCPVFWNGPTEPGSSFDSASTRPAMSFSRDSRPPSPERRGDDTFAQEPILGYVNREVLGSLRQNLYRVAPCPGDRRPNAPVLGLQHLRAKLLQPANLDEDPHFVGLVIAMAQSLFYSGTRWRTTPQPTPRGGIRLTDEESLPAFRDVPIRLVTVDEARHQFIVYTANVTATFLERFARPSEAPRPTPANSHISQSPSGASEGGLDINYTKVPVFPLWGLKERMAKALGPDIAGDMSYFDAQNVDSTLDLFETPRERETRLCAKRRRLQKSNELEQRSHQHQLSSGQMASQTQSSQPDRHTWSTPRRKRPHPTSSQQAQTKALLDVFNTSLAEGDDEQTDADFDSQESRGEDPVFSPRAKRRCARPVHSLEVC
jgi:hypothetical protein